MPFMILKDDDFEIGISEADAFGDFEITTIVSDLGDEGEAGHMGDAIHIDGETGDGAAQLADATMPIGQFAEACFQIEIEFVDDAGVEPDTGHEGEMAAGMAGAVISTEADARGNGMQELRGGAVRAVAEAEFVGENVGGTGGQGAEDDVGAGEAVDGLIDGSVTTGREDEIEVIACLAGQFAGLIRTGGGDEFDLAARFLKHFDGSVQTRAP